MKIIDDEITTKVEMELWNEKFIFEKKEVAYFEIGNYIYSIADHYPCPTYFDSVKKHKIDNCYYTGYFEYLTYIGKKEYICNGHVSLLNSPYTPYFANEQEAVAALEQVKSKRRELALKYSGMLNDSPECNLNLGTPIHVIGNKELNIIWGNPQTYLVSKIDNEVVALVHQDSSENTIHVNHEEIFAADSFYFTDAQEAKLAIQEKLNEISKKTSADMARRLSKLK